MQTKTQSKNIFKLIFMIHNDKLLPTGIFLCSIDCLYDQNKQKDDKKKCFLSRHNQINQRTAKGGYSKNSVTRVTLLQHFSIRSIESPQKTFFNVVLDMLLGGSGWFGI